LWHDEAICSGGNRVKLMAVGTKSVFSKWTEGLILHT